MSGITRQLVYLSDAKFGLKMNDIEKILTSSRRNNLNDEVTGLLIYSDGVFIQILEGVQKTVERVFQRILDDSRHENVAILLDNDVETRAFANWEMAFIESTPEELGARAGVNGALDRSEVLRLLSQDQSRVTIFLHNFASALGD